MKKVLLFVAIGSLIAAVGLTFSPAIRHALQPKQVVIYDTAYDYNPSMRRTFDVPPDYTIFRDQGTKTWYAAFYVADEFRYKYLDVGPYNFIELFYGKQYATQFTDAAGVVAEIKLHWGQILMDRQRGKAEKEPDTVSNYSYTSAPLDSREICKLVAPWYLKLQQNKITGNWVYHNVKDDYMYLAVRGDPDNEPDAIGMDMFGYGATVLQSKDTCKLKKYLKAYLDHMARETFK